MNRHVAFAFVIAGITGFQVVTAWKPCRAQVHLTADIPATRDNTIYQEGSYSNGLGQYIFAGNNAGGADATPDARRALLYFAIADNLPAGALIDSVRMTLYMSKTIAPASALTIHKLTADWGEGSSNATGPEGAGADALPGDATWLRRFFDTTSWTTPGGDFVAGTSASQMVGSIGSYVWKSTQMRIDVQSWLDSPVSNFGWILIGDETVSATAKRFDSREHSVVAYRPKLTVYYTTQTVPVQSSTWGSVKALYRR